MSSVIHIGSVLDQLARIPDELIQTVITSPPYWGMRDYGTGTWTGGNPQCSHVTGQMRRGLGLAASPASTSGGAIKCASVPDITARAICPHCGAIRADQQLGMEETPEEYVSNLVEVFREVRRTLCKTGTLWLVLGDSYNAKLGQHKATDGVGSKQATNFGSAVPSRWVAGLKPKNLIGMPWMVAFALRADGWHLRQDIIWHKPNPMPESVTDRCTKSHEYVFLLSRSPQYYFNADAIKEPCVKRGTPGHLKAGAGKKHSNHAALLGPGWDAAAGRNKRDVWTIATQSYKGAHFAVFPERLVEPCLLAGSAVGDAVLDPFCGSGTVGIVAKHYGRDFIGIDLNPDYVALANERISKGSKKLKGTYEQCISESDSDSQPDIPEEVYGHSVNAIAQFYTALEAGPLQAA